MNIAERINGAARRLPAWPIYIVGVALPGWLFWRAATGGLGVDPIEAMEKTLGLWGLKLIVAGLCVTPLRRFAGVNLIRFRRALGLLAFFYILLHFLTWLLLDLGLRWEQALGDIIKRPYITVGFSAFVLLLPLAATSTNAMVRRLGAARWQALHRAVYVIAILGVVHFWWLVKKDIREPLAFAAVLAVLLGVRLVFAWRKRAVAASARAHQT